MVYEWVNQDTHEIVEHSSADTPPLLPGAWVRVFSFGLSSVQGGGWVKGPSFHPGEDVRCVHDRRP